MTPRILTLTLALSLLALPALASPSDDHSGFGKSLFSQTSPAGFSDPVAYIQDMDAAAAVANDIEPASGAPEKPQHSARAQ